MSDEPELENGKIEADYDEDEHKDTMSPQDVVDKIAKGGEQVIIDWHNTIIREPPKFDAFLEPVNAVKNRYPNVILYDRSRVKLHGNKVGDDYYHASYVDSYNQADGYILAQAPFNEGTESDFWRMIFETSPKLIILLTDTHNREGNRLVKHFWPESKANHRNYPETNIKVNYTKGDTAPLYDWYNFSISNTVIGSIKTITVPMLHYRKWIYDKIIPDDLLEFRSEVGLLETASIVRKQRYGCMTYYSHYSHVADLIVRHAIATGVVER
uniref:Tyrosine-protein phosphatase domain-containing protein n=1 Tax=Setaria digitata TaxID=48799 RepID=A0A915Q129_9BILA